MKAQICGLLRGNARNIFLARHKHGPSCYDKRKNKECTNAKMVFCFAEPASPNSYDNNGILADCAGKSHHQSVQLKFWSAQILHKQWDFMVLAAWQEHCSGAIVPSSLKSTSRQNSSDMLWKIFKHIKTGCSSFFLLLFLFVVCCFSVWCTFL